MAQCEIFPWEVGLKLDFRDMNLLITAMKHSLFINQAYMVENIANRQEHLFRGLFRTRFEKPVCRN